VSSSYGQFCPVSKAAEILCERWTPLVVRELLAGSTRFNELRRGLPGCSTAMLAQRLKTLERAGVVTRNQHGGSVTYALTPAGWELFPLVQGLGEWGQRWARSRYPDDELDPGVLLWDVRRYVTHTLGGDRRVVQFTFPQCHPSKRHYWLVLTADQVDVCFTDPGWAVDVTIEADLRALTQVWMGDVTFGTAMRAGGIVVDAPSTLARKLPRWFGRHPILGGVAAAAI
jgi:DNA-binding HxlR family transcriptional regulator